MILRVAATVLGALVAFGAWLRLSFDPASFHDGLLGRLLGDEARAERKLSHLRERIKARHRGAPPCILGLQGADVFQREVDETLEELSEGGLLASAEHAMPLLALWTHDQEMRQHGPDGDEELLGVDFASAEGLDRIRVALNSDRLREVASERSAVVLRELEKRAEEVRLAEPARENLKNIHARHAKVFSPVGWVLLLPGLRAWPRH